MYSFFRHTRKFPVFSARHFCAAVVQAAPNQVTSNYAKQVTAIVDRAKYFNSLPDGLKRSDRETLEILNRTFDKLEETGSEEDRNLVKSTIDATLSLQANLRDHENKMNERSILMSLPSQNNLQQAAEMGALLLTAIAGALSVSLHYTFLGLFGFSIALYRKSTSMIRARIESHARIEELTDDLIDLTAVIAEEKVRLEELVKMSEFLIIDKLKT